MSRYRQGKRTVGNKTFDLDIELIELTTPHGVIPTVRMVYAHNGIQYASAPLADLPPDIQTLFKTKAGKSNGR